MHITMSLASSSTVPPRWSSVVAELDISHPTYMIWGANTDVGKTLVSTGLAASVLSNSSFFFYLKPLQTGFPRDSDSHFLHRKVSELVLRRQKGSGGPGLVASCQALKVSVPAKRDVAAAAGEGDVAKGELEGGWSELDLEESSRVVGVEQQESQLMSRTLYSWNEAVSPHLAAEKERAAVGDAEVVASVSSSLMAAAVAAAGRFPVSSRRGDDRGDVWMVIETAGGVASPGPSGTLQCDLYRPFRIPAILVGDGRLGGISATISAYESLKLRGYDVDAIVLMDHGLSNELPLMFYLRNKLPVLVLPPIPQDPSDNLSEWFDISGETFHTLRKMLSAAYSQRMQRMHEMAAKAGEVFWWPFTQHNLVPSDSVTVIDSRLGGDFAVLKVCDDRELLSPQFDACASWWTQGPNATLQMELAREMGYATARFGHVMFPENVHEPALRCAELLLEGVGKGWASRTFFSDNGSTAIEIALKMAFRKFSFDHGLLPNHSNEISDKLSHEIKVLALSGSYHGDTLGAMEAQMPSSYTSFLQQPWYSGRGVYLDPPTVFNHQGSWNLSVPTGIHHGQWGPIDLSFSSRDELFNWRRDSSDLAQDYCSYIVQHLSKFSASDGSTHIGALIMEPIIHGAGGMHMIDPLFQRMLVKECRNRNIPIIFDEVFTGFWRLGTESAAQLLGCFPDIACYAKLMTGGIIPLAATLTSESVFNAFRGDSKAMALLHGHSYSAHAMGCTAAAKAIQCFKDPEMNQNISRDGKLDELWDSEVLQQLSCHNAVQRVIALGTLCAVELKAEGTNVGYASMYARSLVQKLREAGIYIRPLGNVIYLMCGPCTLPRICKKLLEKLYQGIEDFSQVSSREKCVS